MENLNHIVNDEGSNEVRIVALNLMEVLAEGILAIKHFDTQT